MNNKLVIIGCGGHSKVCKEIAEMNGYQEILFLDDKPSLSDMTSGTTKDLANYVKTHDFFVAIGNNYVREEISKTILSNEGNLVTLIHPNSVISKSSTIGNGTVVMAGVVINANTIIGNGCIINTCSSIDHDCIINDYCHIAVGSHIAGTVNVGRKTFIGAGATVINDISVCENVVVGAGAVIVSDIHEIGTYVGVPSKKIK